MTRMPGFPVHWPPFTRWRLALALAGLAGLVAGLLGWQRDGDRARYQTQAVTVGEIVQTVTANGTLNPVVLVNVGTQISGRIVRLHVDYNQRVRQGQVLAELDTGLLDAQLASSEANLRLAEANFQRARALHEQDYIARADYEQAETSYAQARAQASRDRINRQYAVIRSPVSGVVVARDVDVGQTVAASFQTPTLFKIAQDLKRMQIDTSVAEADIGALKAGLPVSFGVDAYPGRRFAARVRQVRLHPTIQQNVVTYNVVVAVDNTEELLRPGMTAHITIEAERRENVLRLPNAALRYRPRADEKNGAPARDAPRERRRREAGVTVYRLSDDAPVPVRIQTGITDNVWTELVSDELQAGDELVTQEKAAKKEKAAGFSLRVH